MGTVGQDDFAAGIYRGREAPPSSVYNAVNALIDDEGQLFERGKSALKTAADVDTLADPLVGIADIYIGGAARTVVWGLGQNGLSQTALYTVDDAGAATRIFTTPEGYVRPFARGVGVGARWYVPFGQTSGTYDNLLAFTGFVAFVTTPPAATTEYLAAVGTPARLVITTGNRAYFSEPGDAATMGTDSYHELPQNAQIVGADSIEDTLVLLTTMGVWTVANMALDPVDDAGNVQHIVQQVNKDVVLWGDPGVAGWAGVLVVPAIDDVYLVSLTGEARSVSESIRPLYRSYVKAGYQPGTATVHRGHYFLPIVNGSTLIDVLVCRLDRPYASPSGRQIYPWTRWAGHAASVAFAQRVGVSTRSPKLLGLSAARVTDLTGTLDVSGAATQDANSTTPTFTVEMNDYDLGPGIRPSTATMARVVYETTGGTPTTSLSSAVGPEGASYSAASLITGGGSSDGTSASAWRVNRKAERIRLKFECASQVTSLILRRIVLAVRETGAQ